MNTEQIDKTEETKNIQQPIGYPDISKANTKFIVIVSLICLLAIFLLSILFPAGENATQSQPSTETTATTETSDYSP